MQHSFSGSLSVVPDTSFRWTRSARVPPAFSFPRHLSFVADQGGTVTTPLKMVRGGSAPADNLHTPQRQQVCFAYVLGVAVLSCCRAHYSVTVVPMLCVVVAGSLGAAVGAVISNTPAGGAVLFSMGQRPINEQCTVGRGCEPGNWLLCNVRTRAVVAFRRSLSWLWLCPTQSGGSLSAQPTRPSATLFTTDH